MLRQGHFSEIIHMYAQMKTTWTNTVFKVVYKNVQLFFLTCQMYIK